MRRLILAAVVAASCVVGARSGEASFWASALSLRAGPVSGVIPGAGPVTNQLTTADGLSGFPNNVLTNNGALVFSGEVRPGNDNITELVTDYVTFNSDGLVIQYGQISLAPTAFADSNLNGIPDIYDPAAPASVVFNGMLEVDWPAVFAWAVAGSAIRQAGASDGVVALNLTGLGQEITYNGPFSLVTAQGSLQYEHAVPLAPLCSNPGVSMIAPARGASLSIRAPLENRAILSVVQTIGEKRLSLSGTFVFHVNSTNEVSFLGGVLTDSSGSLSYVVDPFALQRTNVIYSGQLRLNDGDPSTVWPDYNLYAVSLTDTNDSNGNGIPDLSDPPTTNVRFEWQFTGSSSTSSVPFVTFASPVDAPEGYVHVGVRLGTNTMPVDLARIARTEFLWAIKSGGAGNDSPAASVISPERHSFVASTFEAIPLPCLQENGAVCVDSATPVQNAAVTEYNRAGLARSVLAIQSPAFAIPRALVSSANGDVIVGGEYAGSLQCKTNFIPSNGLTNGFIIRSSPDGTVGWIRSLTKARVSVLMSDPSDHLMIAGLAENGAAIGNVNVPSHGLFVAKLTATGDPVWVQSSPLAELVVGDIVADSMGNIFVTGGAYVDDGAGFSKQIFLRKYSAEGLLQWNIEAGGNDHDRGVKIALAPMGDIYLACAAPSSWFRFDGKLISEFPTGAAAGLLKLTPTGKLVWCKFISCPIPSMAPPVTLTLTENGDPRLIGAATPSAVDTGDLSVPVSPQDGYYVAQFDSNGNTRYLYTIPVPVRTSPGVFAVDPLGELTLSLPLGLPIQFGDFQFEPEMLDVVTLYVGRSLELQSEATAGNLLLRWPRSWPDAWLQTKSDLNEASWASITRGSAATEFDFVYNAATTNRAGFYRLQRPPE